MLTSLKSKWTDWLGEHPLAERAWGLLSGLLPPINYITIHYGYFIAVIAASSLIFWGSSQPFGSVDYVDSLFLVTSAMTNTGLNTRNLSEMSTWQQIQLWFLLMIGSPIWVSFWTVMVRKNAFERRFEDIVETERERRRQQREARKSGNMIRRAPNLLNMLSFNKNSTDPTGRSPKLAGLGSRAPNNPHVPSTLAHEMTDLESRPAGARAFSAPLSTIPSSPDSDAKTDEKAPSRDVAIAKEDDRDHISFAEPPSPLAVRQSESRTSAYQHNNQVAPSPNLRRNSDATVTTAQSGESEDFLMHWKKILGKHNVSRSGQFYDLTSDEREHLGGCEYRALKILAVAVPLYSAMWQFWGAVALGCYVGLQSPEIPRANGENPWWAGIFFSVSAFNNGGFTLINDSIIPFRSHYFVLFAMGALILAGNTAYPIFLRLSLWTILKILQLTTQPLTLGVWKETLEFILKYPRRVYTTLFPSRATWWLFGVLLVTNIVDWLAFEILNIGNPEVNGMPVGQQIMAGLFQAICKLPMSNDCYEPC